MDKTATKLSDFRQELADKIIKAVEENRAPWQQEWTTGANSAAFNGKSEQKYRGVNAVNLAMVQAAQGYERNDWYTYKQASELGGQVRKGEKGTRIELWRFTETQDLTDENGKPMFDKDGKPIKQEVRLDTPRVQYFTVFNGSQIDNMPEKKIEVEQRKVEALEVGEKLLSNAIAGMGVNFEHTTSDKAYYRRSEDRVVVPNRDQFNDAGAYYSTALHELGHATGHEARLNREMGSRFGSPDYAREELRAEIASWMTSMETGLPHDPNNHAAYLQNWLGALKKDPNELFVAIRDASKIVDFIKDKALEHEQSLSVEQTAELKQDQLIEQQLKAVPGAELVVHHRDAEKGEVLDATLFWKDEQKETSIAMYPHDNSYRAVVKDLSTGKFEQDISGKFDGIDSMRDTAISVVNSLAVQPEIEVDNERNPNAITEIDVDGIVYKLKPVKEKQTEVKRERYPSARELTGLNDRDDARMAMTANLYYEAATKNINWTVDNAHVLTPADKADGRVAGVATGIVAAETSSALYLQLASKTVMQIDKTRIINDKGIEGVAHPGDYMAVEIKEGRYLVHEHERESERKIDVEQSYQNAKVAAQIEIASESPDIKWLGKEGDKGLQGNYLVETSSHIVVHKPGTNEITIAPKSDLVRNKEQAPPQRGDELKLQAREDGKWRVSKLERGLDKGQSLGIDR